MIFILIFDPNNILKLLLIKTIVDWMLKILCPVSSIKLILELH